ncbi:flagellar hook-associated protein FlgK [Ruminococcaceae bacterium OttesenSCG-928-A11]|nr:flagellar hook-associated protein FlgK [Ruminococcaceae bacterium OttesenSCG-928-A11]
MSVRPTFMGFETSTRGLQANQKALDVVGNNTANIGVTGYTRQRVDLVSLSVNMRYTRYNTNSTAFAGQGVGVYGVSQIRDSFLDKRFREEYSDVGYYGATSAILEDLTGALDEIAPANLTTVMTKFQDAWDEMLGGNVNEATQAANLQTVATQLAQVLRQMSAKVDNVWNQQEYSLEMDVDNINSILKRIAELNEAIGDHQFNSLDPGNSQYQPLELMDERNVLLDQLSGYADIYYETDDKNMVTVWMGPKDEKNPPVVEKDVAQKLNVQIDDSNPNYKTVSVFWNNTGNEVSFTSGSIRGMLDMLNGRGLGMTTGTGETWNQGIHYYKDKINTMAKVVADAFNSVIEIVDYDSNGNPVAYDPPRYKALFAFENDAYETAAGIRVSDEWEADSSYIIKDLADKLLGGGSDDNNFAAKVAQLFEEKFDFGEFRGTFQEYIQFYSNTKLGNDKSYSDSRLETVSSISETLLDQIQEISGVNFDEEGVDMMQYKKAYDAVSRVFTTLDEMLDKLINSTGRVGL